MKKTYEFSFAFAIMLFVSPLLFASSEFVSDLNSPTMVKRVVGTPEKNFGYVVYKRKSFTYTSLNPDYFYMWHGDKQKSNDFMNLTDLLGNSESLDKSHAVFLSLDTESKWSERVEQYTSLHHIARLYQSESGVRREISVGYDMGVAKAYGFACKYKMNTIILSQGGLYDGESCSPSGAQVLYSINEGGGKFPLSRPDTPMPTLVDRLDATESIARLRSLLHCSSVPMESQSVTGIMSTYACGQNNKLVVLYHKFDKHQWNGYRSVSSGFSNQEGEPVLPPLNHWIKSELHVQ